MSRPTASPGRRHPILDDPTATPLVRMTTLAEDLDIGVFDVPAGEWPDGAAAVVSTLPGDEQAMVGLRDTVTDDDLRVDLLAFAVALLAASPELVAAAPGSMVCIGSERLPAAKRGPGHLAWWLLHDAGRVSPSATFEIITPPDD